MGDENAYAPPQAVATRTAATTPPTRVGLLSRALFSGLCAACSILYILAKLKTLAVFSDLGIEPAGLCRLLMANATIALHLTLVAAAWIPIELRFSTARIRPLSVGALCFAMSLSMVIPAVFSPIIQVIEELGRHA